ncbi:polymorphic toxin-type HINT domain-containing protein [Streptomyces sp. cg40]|uniref:polymorphic toxin-type HINT domain-containing protein n=1 Tax=Streptomyces sp. cg40 TaxID=3419764 RepID=UPI003D004891
MNPASRARRPRAVLRRWLGRGALAVSLALIPQTAVPSGSLPATAAEASSTAFPAPPKPKVNKVLPFKAKKRTTANKAAAAAKSTQRRLADVHWPTAADTRLPLSAAGTSVAKAGSLPVSLSPAKTKQQPTAKTGQKATTGSLGVRVYGHQAAHKAGINGTLIALTPDQALNGGAWQFHLNYASFADAYGGSYGSRLTFVQLPQCALTTPTDPKCQVQKPLASHNDPAAKTVSVTLPATAGASAKTPMLLAATAASSGPSGDFSASPLGPSATWEAGGSTGDFNWSYPLRVPPATAGPAPNLAISYSSASVDGRTSSENNQTTVVGEGFGITESYIERKYGSCKEDGNDGKGDLCWKYANATLVLNGKAVDLVNACTDTATCDTAEKSQAAGGTWRLKNDDATKVEHLTGNTSNGDDNGEYWKVTTTDGTQYYFGKHRLPGWSDHGTDPDDPVTNSTWTAPVFGDDAGEPCHDTTYASSSCTQAWKWNLDYVVDTHNNAMSYWYGKETNNYAKNGVADPATGYDRAGYLKRIDYGLRSTSIYTKPAAQQVSFDYAQRCVASDCSSLTTDTKANWPDVPFDLICADGKACTGKIGPSFFTRYMLTDVTTSVWTGTGTTRRNVDNWHLEHSFPDSGDASSPSLWLQSIQNTGKADTTEASLPPITFDGIQLSNHVDGGGDTLRYIKWRVRRITSETGGVLEVNYSDPQCIRGTTMPSSEDNNTLRCFPVYWSQSGATPELDWFHKYVVTSVFEDDLYGSDSQETRYTYDGGAGWGYSDDDGLTKAKYRTWNQWRGYAKVTTTSGDDTGPTSKTVNLYMRGLNGEKEKDGTPRVAKVTDSTGTSIDDDRQYAGFVRETIAYDGNSEVSGTINTPWSLRTGSHTYDWGTTESYFMQPAAITNRTKTSTGTRSTRTTTTYDPTYGMPLTVEDQGDIAKTGDEICTRTSYARNTTDWLVQFTSRVESYAVGCDKTPKLPDDTISDVTTGYDNQAVGTAPTKGESTSSYRLSGYNTQNQPTYQKVSTTTYDDWGRPESTTDADNRTTKTAYVPDDTGYGPLTQSTVTDPKLYTVTTDVDPAWGQVTKQTDRNSKVTEWQFDALGRVTSIWKPNRSRALKDAASLVYAYSLTKDKAPWVRTDTLKADGKTYNSSYEIYDALLRKRQTQVPAVGGGRVISETLYDDRGLAYLSNSQVYDNISPTSALANTLPASVPASTETVYDGAGRPTDSIFRVNGQERWRTKTNDQGDQVAVTAAKGGSGTLTIKDARGRVTERREYASPSPTGSDYTRTKYTYTPAGQLDTVTGPDNAVWRHTYDIRGRETQTSDPDKGTTDLTYDDADQPLTATVTKDGTSRTLISDYDTLGRKIGTWDGTKDDAHQLTKFTYDSVAKGQLSAAIRYVGGTTGRIYATQVTAYNNLYQPTTTKTILAAADPLVQAGAPQTFTNTTAYNLDGTVNNTILPAAGGLPTETVAYTYNDLGLVDTVSGNTNYIRSIGYTQYGEPLQTTLATSATAKQLQVSDQYEDGTRRLLNSHTKDQTNTGLTSDVDYTYDDTGNVLSIKQKTGPADNQCFAYDGHQRLSDAWTPQSGDCSANPAASTLGGPAPYWTSWTYTTGGMRDTQIAHTTSGDTKTTYNYPPVNAQGAGQPHTLTSTTGEPANTYKYDEQGNTTRRPGASGNQTLTWNIEGQLDTLTESGKTTSYLYDANGQLLLRQGTAETVLYLGGQELHYDPATKKFTAQRYYSAGDGTALRTPTGLYWIVDDRHGTASMVVDSATQQITRRYTKPFGESRGSAPAAWPDDKGFLGKPVDSSTGLTHIGAREYDPAIGRFLSGDPVFSADDHESLNGYAYADNTPVTASDPTGLKVILGCEEGCKDSNGNWYRLNASPKPNGGLEYNRTTTYTSTVNSGNVNGTLSAIVTSNGSQVTVRVVFKKGPKPAPIEHKGNAPYVNGVCVYAAAGNCGSNQEDAGSAEIPELGCAKDDGLCGVRNSLLKTALVSGMLGGSLGVFSIRGGCSFSASTPVLLEHGKTKTIKKIKPGDKVEAGDPGTGKHTGTRTVTATFINHDDDLIDLTVRVQGGKTVILHTTSEHPFWDDTERAWVSAGKLKPGHLLNTVRNRHALLTAVRVRPGEAAMYNLTVDDLHTYYVVAGGAPILVHNTCGPADVTVSWKPGMPKSQFNLKAAALQDLSDSGVLYKAPNPVARDSSITNNYKANLIARVFDQFGATNPEFAASLRTRILTQMNPDHVWELQLGGPDAASNLHILEAYTNQDIGRQIWGQIRNLPDYTPIRINTLGPP